MYRHFSASSDFQSTLEANTVPILRLAVEHIQYTTAGVDWVTQYDNDPNSRISPIGRLVSYDPGRMTRKPEVENAGYRGGRYNDLAGRNGSWLCWEATMPRDSSAGSSRR